MSVKLRMRRMGRKKLPIFGLVAADSRAPRDGRFIEDLGRYAPVSEPATFTCNEDRVVYWLSQGAQMSDTVRNLLQKEGVLYRAALVRKGEMSAEEIDAEVDAFRQRRADKTPTVKTKAERRQEALEAERKKAAEEAEKIAAERREKEAELQRLRAETEAKERAEREALAAQRTADAADAAALANASDEAPAAEETSAVEAASAETASEETPTAEADETPAEDAAAAEAADAQAEAEASGEEGADAAVAETTEEAVADAAPDAAEEQPAVEDTTSDEVAAETGDEVADQAEAGAAEGDEVEAAETPAAEEASETDGDDLTKIWGVGPKYASILNEAGMTSFSQVAEASVEALQGAITDAGSTTAGNEETWPEQAKLLAAGDTDGHDAYVTKLKAD